MDLLLPLGNSLPDLTGLENAYAVDGSAVTAVLSAQQHLPLLRAFTQAMSEPEFFFIELPCTDDEEKELDGGDCHYKLYYLDNCTKPVIKAVLDRFGDLLCEDGLCRFGFGENEKSTEIYIREYGVISIWCEEDELLKKAEEILKGLGAAKKQSIVTPWDIISPDNPGTQTAVTYEDMRTEDIPDMLKDAGMYFDRII